MEIFENLEVLGRFSLAYYMSHIRDVERCLTLRDYVVQIF